MRKDARVIGFIGGTGPEGRGLALRFAQRGHKVLLGSRDRSRAEQAASRVTALTGSALISGDCNRDVAAAAEFVFVAVPYTAQRVALHGLQAVLDGKIVVVVAAPITVAGGVARAMPVEEGSAALQAKALLPGSRIVGAFQTISAHDLLVPDKAIDSDVVVCADDTEAKRTVMDMAEEIEGVRAVDGGGLENAGYVESFTALLMNINRLYRARSSIKIAGI